MPLKGCSDAHSVGGVLKLYLASLPEPLLSYRLYDSLLAVAAVPAQSRRILALGSLLQHLDPPSKTTLGAILAFLQRVATATAASSAARGAGQGGAFQLDAVGAHGAAVRELARVFSPLLLRLRGSREDGGAPGGELAEDVARAEHVVELLIEHHAGILSGGKVGAVTSSGLAASSNAMNAGAGGAGEDNVVGTTRAIRGLELNDKENVKAVDKMKHAKPAQKRQASAAQVQPAIVVADPLKDVDALMGTCTGSLMGGDDLFTAVFDRVAGTGLEVLYRAPVHRMAPDELAVEKQGIKRRLRSFDNHVAACCGRKATKEDKRHLRPLYLRLAHVKRQIHVVETTRAGMGQYPTYRGGAQQQHWSQSGAGGAGHDKQRSSARGTIR